MGRTELHEKELLRNLVEMRLEALGVHRANQDYILAYAIGALAPISSPTGLPLPDVETACADLGGRRYLRKSRVSALRALVAPSDFPS